MNTRKASGLHTHAILRAVARNTFRPRIERLILHVTHQCPLNCGHCFVDKTSPQDEEITVKEVTDIANALGPLTWLDIGGGEPFLRDDIVELCLPFQAADTDIPTSGWMVDKTVAAAGKLTGSISGRFGVSVSLDGFRDTHDRLRQEGSFDRAMETLKGLKSIPGLRVSVISTLSEANCDELPDFVRFMQEQHLADHNINLLRGSPADSSLKLPDEDQLRVFRAKLRDVMGGGDHHWNGLFSGLAERLHYRYVDRKWMLALKALSREEQLIPCLAGQADLVVYPNGDVAPCELLPPAGNIRHEPLNAIFEGKRWQSTLSAIRRRECHCTHECNMFDSTLLSLRNFCKVMFTPEKSL